MSPFNLPFHITSKKVNPKDLKAQNSRPTDTTIFANTAHQNKAIKTTSIPPQKNKTKNQSSMRVRTICDNKTTIIFHHFLLKMQKKG